MMESRDIARRSNTNVRNSPSTNAPVRFVTNVAHGNESGATWISRETP